MSGVRRKTARSISRAWSEAPQVTQNDRADVTELERLRKLWSPKAEASGGKLTVTAILLKVVATALKVFPRFNAAVDMEALEVVYRRYVNIGVAVDAGHGLLVPVIRDADQKNILTLSAELTDLSMRARNKKVAIEEMRGAGFTITNLGGLGTTTFTPIINWPEVAILGVGRAETQAVWNGESFEPRSILPLSLTYDHRVIDGADAARFLRWIAEALEHPLKLAMEGY
jgi:pyruvate dehydrogenase E2 component (dihydrolipoamide acetyltransferase)